MLMQPLFSHSLQGILRFVILKIRGKDYYISGSCEGCGNCCRKINLKTSKGWIRSEVQFRTMLEIHEDFNRFQIIGKDEQGFLQFTCSWLLPSGLCKDHQHRLKICKIYPAKSLMFCGGKIPDECGFKIQMVTPFDKILKQEQKRCK